jgi:hypothetical protein
MDLFAQYATQAVPASVQRKQEKAEKAPSALDLKMAEKQRLTKSYRAARRQIAVEILASEPRLAAFARFIKKASGGSELVEAIANSWLPAASQDVKHFALRLVSARCDRLDRAAGFSALDDPLPPETSTFFEARNAMGAR